MSWSFHETLQQQKLYIQIQKFPSTWPLFSQISHFARRCQLQHEPIAQQLQKPRLSLDSILQLFWKNSHEAKQQRTSQTTWPLLSNKKTKNAQGSVHSETSFCWTLSFFFMLRRNENGMRGLVCTCLCAIGQNDNRL